MNRYCAAIFLLSSNGINPHLKCDSCAEKWKVLNGTIKARITNGSFNVCYHRNSNSLISQHALIWRRKRVARLGMLLDHPMIHWSFQRDFYSTRARKKTPNMISAFGHFLFISFSLIVAKRKWIRVKILWEEWKWSALTFVRLSVS